MSDAALIAIHHHSHVAFFSAVGACGSPGARWATWPGVGAAVVPAVPERSLPNSVLYEDARALLDCYDEVAAAYADAGIAAFTVWVEPADEAALVPELERRGHRRDGQPMLQVAELADLDLGTAEGAPLDLEPAPSFGLLGELNERAWRMPEGTLAPAFAGLGADPAARVWIARSEGRPASGLMIQIVGGDAYVTLVATAPEAQGHGLGRRLLARALRECKEAGCTTTTLEASAAGEPIYARMGYRSLHRLPMYERRSPAENG